MRGDDARSTRRQSTVMRLLVVVVGAALAATLVSACSDPPPPTIDYAVDAKLSTYNANTREGNANGVLMATTRVLPGFSYLGDAGQVTPDRDVGTVTREPGGRLTLRYDFNPKATYSDGVPLTCDEIVLAWAAMSGRFDDFTPATTAGYRDIDSVDCTPGAKTATVTFAAGRDYQDWASLFGAGTLLPAHVVARDAGVANIVDPIRARNRAVIERIAKSWNTGFDFTPGHFDRSRFPASGPYRFESYSTSGGLVLVANDTWWGDRPAASRITMWGRGNDVAQRLADGAYDVADVTAGLAGGQGGPRPTDGAESQALAVEGLVLSGRGVFADVRVRRAFASCVPRDGLARQFGSGAQMWNMRVLAPGDELAASLNGEFGREYQRPDLGRTRTLLAEAAGTADDGTPRRASRTVRIGYLAPTPRWNQMVAAINASCASAGITVTDTASSVTGVGGLGSQADALLVASGASFSAAGSSDPIRDAYQLRGGDPLNLTTLNNPQVNTAIDQLAVADLEAERLGLVRTIETDAWAQVASIPLFAAPRVRHWNDQVDNVVAGLGRNGTGWNMDRWMLT
ncbi:ABC transporter substrate-binding protein [Gordonia sp. NPDC003504]